MKVIKSISDLENVLNLERIIPVDATKLDTYADVHYSCGCGCSHDVAGRECINVLSAKTVKVLLRCENDFYTFIQIKGLFSLKTISHWSFQADLVEREEGEPPYRYQVNTKSWVDFFTKDKARLMIAGRRMGILPH